MAMSKTVRVLLFIAWVLISAILLYGFHSAQPFTVYLRYFFPVSAYVVLETWVWPERRNDLDASLGRVYRNLGTLLVIASLPALALTACAAFGAPYVLAGWLYLKVGVPSQFVFPCALFTPIGLGCLVLFVRSRKGCSR
jgi:hypothetical protein